MSFLKAEKRTFYRERITAKDLVSFPILIKETDLLIFADNLPKDEAENSVLIYRHQLEDYILKYPHFLDSLIPLPLDESAPSIIQEMMRSAQLAQVGPMASVAGAIAEFVGKDLLKHTKQVVVENGGDIFIKIAKDLTIGIYAGDSPLSNKLGLKIAPDTTPLGVCTSSGTVGHSLSFGKSDAVTIIAQSTSLADAAATSIGNLVKEKKDIEAGLERAKSIKGIHGALIIVGDQFGAWGNLEIVSI
ncbi:MAG: UPF0280 family protein [Deltaproteobacteria bacterium]|nr:UPF0280 family protein [Deltaproteobacteria bacterium]